MKKHIIYLLALCILLMNGCQKELSFEGGNTPSDGSLQSDVSGDCLPKTINGAYVAGTPLVPATNTIAVQVNVTKAGSYEVYTDTVNGYFFRATGTFTALGANTVTLRSTGTPFTAGVNNFIVSYNGTICDIAVTVLPAGAGGPAAFTLQGSPTTCGAVVNGNYSTTVALGVSNTVTLTVNVTAIGTYTISTAPTGGMTFAASGVFAATGVQTVILNGSGTPTTGGNNTIPVTAGASSCSFVVNVGGPAAGTLGGGPGACTPATIHGLYILSTVLTAADTVQIQVNVTTAGVYNITTNTVTGFSFSSSGNFATTGIQNVTLTGTGTPTTLGPQTFTVTFGTSSCTFTVTVAPIDYFPRTTNSNWSYEFDDNPIDSILINVIPQTLTVAPNTYNIFMYTPDITLGFDTSGYYRKNAGDYFQFFDVGAFVTYDNPQWVEYVMLKDNVPVNTNWKSAGYAGTITPPNPPGGAAQALTIRFSYTILQKDVSLSITTSTGTVNYDNVIVVEEKYEQLTGPGTWTDITSVVGYGKSYYARGIGLIKYENFDNTGALFYQQELRRYQVF
jgi:hypothetical protein